MGFQTTVNVFSGAGVVGEFYSDSPRRAESYILDSDDATNNVFGRAFTKVSQGVAQVGGTGVFAGFLINPKASVNYGILGDALAPTLTLANNVQAELCTWGTFFVLLPAAAAIGDVVLYDTTTGELSTISPGDTYPSGTLPTNAVVDYFTVSGAGLAVITATDVPPVPLPTTPA